MRILIAVALACGIVMAACGDDDNTSTSNTPRPTVASQGVQPSTPGQPTAPGQASSPAALSDGNAPGIPPLTGEIQTDQGLRFIDEKVGDGASPTNGETVTVHYTGWLTDGSKFDSSVDRGQPYEFLIGTGRVIPGWDIGVASMKAGGKRRLIIPSDLAYGPDGRPPRIPQNATLIFDVELLGVQ
jgi:peptidylprolyl isomerase